MSGKPLHNNGGALRTGYITVAAGEKDCNKNAKCFAYSHGAKGSTKDHCNLWGKSAKGSGKNGQCYLKPERTPVDIADS